MLTYIPKIIYQKVCQKLEAYIGKRSKDRTALTLAQVPHMLYNI